MAPDIYGDNVIAVMCINAINDTLEKTEKLISILQDMMQAPTSLEDGEVFEQIVDKVLVGRNKKIVFQLINGLELTGSEGNNDGEK